MTLSVVSASSTMSLNVADRDSEPVNRLVIKEKRDPGSRLVRTYSNCSYTLVNTFRLTAECRATLPGAASRTTQQASYGFGHIAASPLYSSLPACSPIRGALGSKRALPDARSTNALVALTPQNRVNKVYESCNPDVALMRSQTPRMLKSLEEIAISTDGERGITAIPSQNMNHHVHKSSRTPDPQHTSVLKPPSVAIMPQVLVRAGNHGHQIRLHPPAGHKVATYV